MTAAQQWRDFRAARVISPAARAPGTLACVLALVLTLALALRAGAQTTASDTGARVIPTTSPAPGTAGDASIEREPVLRMSLAEFVSQVGRHNLDYAAQAFNVPIADAQVSVARLFPNPTLSWGTALDVSGQRQATSYDLAITQSVLLGGKRGARTDVARNQREAARAQLDDFLRILRGTAATAYVDAVHAEQVYTRQRRTVEDLDRLVTLDERRVQAGDVGEIDLVQSRVEAAQSRGQLLSAENAVRAARLALTGLLSPRPTDTLVAPTLPSDTAGAVTVRAPDVDSLARAAVASRPDVLAARRLLDAAVAGIRVARADRWSDVDITVGTSYFGRGTSTIDPTPIFASVNIGLSVPIPLSNLTHGELAAARYTRRQAAKTLESSEWKAAIEVRTAWAAYQAAVAQLAQYTERVLADAERVRRAKLYSYQRGSASLLDVLTAEQATNDVYIASYDAEQAYAHAAIALAQATGTWSLVFTEPSGPRSP